MTTLEESNPGPTLTKTPTAHVGTQIKRYRPADDLPVKGVITNLSGDICKHCDKRCTETGDKIRLFNVIFVECGM